MEKVFFHRTIGKYPNRKIPCFHYQRETISVGIFSIFCIFLMIILHGIFFNKTFSDLIFFDGIFFNYPFFQ